MSEKQALRPFIPSWLDDAGLSQAEFRLYCHLCRRADNKTGIAWPSYAAMIKTCGGGKTTIRRSIESLSERGLIEKLGKPFGDTCRYRILSSIVPPQGQMRDSNSSATGTIEAGPIVPPQDCNSSTTGTPIVPPQGQEGNPSKVIQRRVSIRESSTEGIQFAQWFKSSLPESVKLQDNWQQSFAKTYDDLVTLDKRTPEQILKVSRWARTDSFWQTNFMSPSKLRKRNRDAITYFDVFAEKMKQPTGNNPSKPITQADLGGRTSKNTEEL
jgi:Helix-turn-helix domain